MNYKRTVKIIFATLCALLLPLAAGTVAAGVINVPEDYPTIQAAIDAASSGDEIIVAPGTYNEGINFNGKAIHLRSTQPEDPEIVAVTILDGFGLGTSPVTAISGEGPGTILEGITITRGTGRPAPQTTRGGGMYVEGSSPTIIRCVFTDNEASRNGGGLYVSTGSSPRVVSSTFERNRAGVNGGAINVRANSVLLLEDSRLIDNKADRDGGGIYCWQSKVEIRNTLFIGNEGNDTGGLLVGNESHAVVTDSRFERNMPRGMNVALLSVGKVTGCTFEGHTSERPGAGLTIAGATGIGHQGDTTSLVADCYFKGNQAIHPEDVHFGWGGGLSISHSPVEVRDSHFLNNTANEGGGIHVSGSSSENPVTVTNCHFEGNEALFNGGALGNFDPSGNNNFVIEGSSFFGNKAALSGGAFYNESGTSPIFGGSVFCENTPHAMSGGWTDLGDNEFLSECPVFGSSFTTWLSDHFGDEGLEDPELTDPSADPGGFGVANLLRYAFDLDPHHPDRSGLPAAEMEVPAGESEAYLTITHTRQVNAIDLHYRVESSEDMMHWEALSEDLVIGVEASGSETELVTIRDTEPISDTGQRFLRVVVELAEE